jgi:hypothetical protein
MKTYAALILTCLFFSACDMLQTKDQYMQKYAGFIDDVKQHYQSYSADNWADKDVTFKKLNVDDYAKFESQLSVSEKAQVLRYGFVYNLVRGNITLTDLLTGKYNNIIMNYSGELISVLKQATLLRKDMKDVISLDLINKIIFPPGNGSSN